MEIGMRILAGVCSMLFGTALVVYSESYFIIFGKFPFESISFNSPASNKGITIILCSGEGEI